MARTLTAPAAAQAARKDGPRPIHILEIAFNSGTRYWSDETLTSPVNAEARVVQWGELQIDGVPGKAGGMGTITLTVRDDDHFLKQEAAAQPGYQRVDATLYLYFAGTTWATDRITLFAGVLSAPSDWDEATACTRITMKGRETLYDPSVGFLMTATSFPEIDCKACENEIIPIVYGNPCRRVPACVVNRPGVAQLAATLTSNPPSTELTIDRSAAEAFFTVGTTIELIVGWPGRWERITGSFSNSADTTFTITARGTILAEGLISTYAAGGLTYLTVPKSSLPDNGATSRAGYPLIVQLDNLSWTAIIITHWWFVGDNIIVCLRGQLDVSFGNAFQILSQPTLVPEWPAGTPVTEAADGLGGGTWTYIANYLPSKAVQGVEIRARVNVAGGDSHVKWAAINPAYYSVNLDDKQYNGSVGRAMSDPGMTTITLDFAPTQLGSDSETIYPTIEGITDDNTSTGTVIEDPALVCENLLENEFIGEVPAGRMNSTSFSTAASDIVTKCSFALLDEKQSLNEVVSDIAHQAGCVFFWDGGQATISRMKPEIAVADSVFTVTNSNRRAGSLRISEIDVKELITEMVGKFRRTVPDDEQRLVRGSEANREDGGSDASSAGGNAGKTDFGVQRDEMDFWAFQFPSSVARATEEWCQRRLTISRIVTVDLFLDAIKLQPGDVITLDIDDGAGTAIFNSTPARIRTIRTRLGSAKTGEMPSLTVTAEVQEYDYAVTSLVPSDDGCAGQNVSGGRARSRRLPVKSRGVGQPLHVVDTPRGGFGTGEAGGNQGEDPSNDVVLGVPLTALAIADRPSNVTSSASGAS